MNDTLSAEHVSIAELPPTGGSLKRFLRLPYSIYGDDPLWVAPLLADLKQVFDPKHNPLFEHASMKLWVATRGGKDVGRIAGIIDLAHLSKHQDATAFWGFFESIDDPTVAKALFGAVDQWASGQGAKRLLGPMNPTTNDECGLLVDGFERPPVFMMTYNPRYYVPLVEGAGFTKAKDLLAYHFMVEPKPFERLLRIAELAERRSGNIVVRSIRKRTLKGDLAKVKEVYNAAWEDNWGFVPMTDAEFDFLAKRIKPLLVEDYSLLAEVKETGEPVAFMLSLPDFNEAIQPLRGTLWTPKVLGFLKYLLGGKTPRISRVVTLGIKREYRSRGIDARLLAHSLQVCLKRGVKECEVSWMLEDNVMILRPIEVFGGTRYKTYRLYERNVMP